VQSLSLYNHLTKLVIHSSWSLSWRCGCGSVLGRSGPIAEDIFRCPRYSPQPSDLLSCIQFGPVSSDHSVLAFHFWPLNPGLAVLDISFLAIQSWFFSHPQSRFTIPFHVPPRSGKVVMKLLYSPARGDGGKGSVWSHTSRFRLRFLCQSFMSSLHRLGSHVDKILHCWSFLKLAQDC
jgi:hypothetical protein